MDSPEISRMTTHIKHDIASATSFGFQDYLRPFMRRPLVHAKLGGADFRAVGNEPGWSLTIAHDSIVLVTDYGETRLAFPSPPVEELPQGRRSVYRARSPGHTLEVVLEAGGCRDSMSGDAFETTVTLTLDGRALRGCGRALH